MATEILTKLEVLNDNDSDEGEVSDSEEEEEKLNLEEGECVEEDSKKKKNEELEEGEVSDEGQETPKPICRFFGKGLCTWGNNCRFLHPGVPDKGLYTMFEPKIRPPPPQHPPSTRAEPAAPIAPIILTQSPLLHPKPLIKTGLLGHAPPNYPQTPYAGGPESAWERGLRHAKEIIKASVKRKETDVDFEEKKMNLSLAQDEIDKENDYYVVRKPEPQAVNKNSDSENDEAENLRLLQQQRAMNKIDPDFVRNRVHRIHTRSDKKNVVRAAPPLHETKDAPKFDDVGGKKSPNWHDPWMRVAKGKRNRTGSSSGESNWEERSSSPASEKRKKRKTSESSSDTDTDSSNSSNSSKSSFDSTRRKKIRKAPPRDFPQQNNPPAATGVRIAPPLPSNDDFHHPSSQQHNQRGGGGGLRGQRGFRYAPPPSHHHQPQQDNRFGNSRFQQNASRGFNRYNNYDRGQGGQRRRSPVVVAQQQQTRYYKRSKFSRDRSSSSSSSNSTNSSHSQQRPNLKRKKKTETDTDTDSSIEIPIKVLRTAPPQMSRKLEEKSDSTPMQQKCQKVKLTLPNKSMSLKDNKNIIEKLDDEEDDIEEIHSPTTPLSHREINSEETTPDRDILMKEKIILNLDPSSCASSSVSKSRREELLKQLKAVEEAIAKKRSKIDKN